MLPAEAFSEAVAFLRLYDLNALVVTNEVCSSLAVKASNKIRWEELPGLSLHISNKWIGIRRHDASTNHSGIVRWKSVAVLTFPNEKDTDKFIAAALSNCVFEDVILSWNLSKPLLDALGRVADSVVLKGALCPPYSMSHDDSLSLLQRFRKVKVSFAILFLLHAVA